MKRVADSEADLLTLARAVVGRASRREARRVLENVRDPFDRIGPTSMALLEQTLSTGVVLQLVERGGWIDDGGRLWQRWDAPEIRFTEFTFELLRWLTVKPVRLQEGAPELEPNGIGDEMVAFLTAELLEKQRYGVRRPVLMNAPLCSLAFAGTSNVAPDPLLVDALQPELARRWVEMVEDKSIFGTQRHIERGAAEGRVLDILLDAIADSRHLGGFLIDAAGRLDVTAEKLIAGFEASAALSVRSDAMRAAARFFEALERLRGWYVEHGLVRFFDDEYDAAQALRAKWEHFGDEGFTRMSQIAESLRRGPS